MLSNRKRAKKSSPKESKKKKLARLNSASNDDDKEFLSLDEHVGSIFDEEYEKMSAPKKQFKGGKMEMSARVCKLTDMQRNRIAHYIIPAFNAAVLPTKSFKDLQKYPSCDITAPSAIYVAKATCAATDICYQRTRVYDHYKNLLSGGRTRYLNQLKKNKRLEGLEKDNIYSSHVFNFAERFNADPDPYFYGSYDYYYTGGNLSKVTATDYLLHVNGENLENLTISSYKPTILPKHAELVHTQTFDTENSEIFEVLDFPASTTNQYNFTVRQRTEFTVSTLHVEECETEVLYAFKAKVPFISSTHIPNYKSHLLTSNMCQQLRLYDLDEAEARIVKQYNINNLKYTQNHSWNMLRPYNEHTIIYANEQEIFLMDPRTSAEEWLRTSCRKTHAAYSCEKISCMAVSALKPIVYVASTHHLHALDLRKFESDLSSKSALYSCTHQMRYPAAFMDTCQLGDIEYIALASAVAGEVRICELGSKEMELSATALAYQPPTLKEAYHHAKLSGRCLQAAADLSKRVALCNTGLTFCDTSTAQANESESHLLSQLLISNSIGDVFAYNLLEKFEDSEESIRARVNEASDEAMQSYAETICSNISPVLQYTDICQMPGIKKAFRSSTLSEGCVVSDEFDLISNPRRLGRWQRSFAALKNFKDALAQDLLSIWDIENEQDRSLNVILPEEKKLNMSTDTKVNNWLNMGTIIAPPMTSVCLPSQNEDFSEQLITSIVMEDKTEVSFHFVNTEQELQLFNETQGTLLPLGQIISTEHVETLTPKEREEREEADVASNKKINLTQIFSRRNSREEIVSIPASSELKSETVKVVHIEVPASTESVTDSNRHEKIAKRPPTPARLGLSAQQNYKIEENLESSKLKSITTKTNNSFSDQLESLSMACNKNDSTNDWIFSSALQTTTNHENQEKHSLSDQSLISLIKIPKNGSHSPEKQKRQSLSDQSLISLIKTPNKVSNSLEKQKRQSLSDQSLISLIKTPKKVSNSLEKQKRQSLSDQSLTKTPKERHSLSDQSLISLIKLSEKDSSTSSITEQKKKKQSTLKKEQRAKEMDNQSTTSSLKKQNKREQVSLLPHKKRNSLSDKDESLTENKRDKTLLSKQKDHKNSISDKSSVKSGLSLLQKKKRKDSLSSNLSKTLKNVENKPNDAFKQINLFDSFKISNVSQLCTTSNKTELNSTVNSSMNATGLNKTKKVLKTKPKFKKYVKGF